MVADQKIVGKELGLALHLMLEPIDDWYYITGECGLTKVDREKFNRAFAALVAGSYEEAFKRFARLSSKGSFVSQYYLGFMHLKGLGVLQDYSRAHLWFNIASSRGHKKSRIQLEKLTKKMSADRVAKAQKLARAWASRYIKTKQDSSSRGLVCQFDRTI